jgi:hypothetical protein
MPNRINGTDPGAEPGASTRGQNKAHSGGGDTGSTYVIKVWGSFAMVPTLPDYFTNANSNKSVVSVANLISNMNVANNNNGAVAVAA